MAACTVTNGGHGGPSDRGSGPGSASESRNSAAVCPPRGPPVTAGNRHLYALSHRGRPPGRSGTVV
eukprot:760659-Hanusia_phi.AAC.4